MDRIAPARAERILEIAGLLAGSPERLDDDDAIRQIPGINETVADLAVLAVADRCGR